MAGRSEHLSKVEQDVERTVLTTKVELNDGTSGYIFSRNPHRNESQMFTYNCHICSVPNLPGERCLYTHIGGRKHQTKLTMKPFNANLFRAPFQRSNKIVMQIAPGEPVPPGFENEVKAVSDIQSKIEKSKNMSFIGLEYLVELRFHEDKEHGYICVLCEKRGDPRTIMDHLTSYKHRLKYLEKHFPTVTREIAVYRYNREARDVLPHVIQKICEAIEDAYGRLAPSVYDNDEYEKNRMSCLQEIINDKHFSEKSGSTFLHVINPKEIDEWIEKNKADFLAAAKRSAAPLEFNAKRGRSSVERRRSLDSISSISSSSLDRSPQRGFEHRKKHLHDKPDDDVIYIRSHSRSLSPRSQTHQRRSRSRDFSARHRSRSPHTRTQSPGRQVIPTPRELSMQAEAIGAEKYKWEKYRCMVEIALKELEKQRLEYDKSPEKHPLYPDEWKIFWNRRYKELQAEKKDPSKYDFTPEWKEFWTKRMIELHEESIEKRKEEIRKSLNLPKDARERTSELKEKFNIKSTRKERLNSPPPSTSLRRDKVEKPYRFGRSRSREKSLKSSDSYKRSSYEREKSIERYDRIERDRREPDRRDRDRERERERERERDRDRERDRERDRDRHHRPTSGGSYHEDSPARYPREEREPSDYYAPNPYKWHANQPKSLYPSKYYGREMPASTIPKYEEQPEEEPENDDPLTVVTVLRLLSALEELLGPSLGPKIVELLAKALALEKVKANSADDLLLNEENCVLFETIKEKLKAQLMNDMVEKHRMKAVKRAIKNIAGVIHLASEKEKNKTPEEKEQEAQMKIKVAAETKPAAVVPETKPVAKTPEDEKREIAKKLAAALVAQGRVDVSKEELETLVNYYYEKRKAAKKEDETEAPNAASTSQTADATETVSVHSPSVKSETSEPPIDLTEEVNEPKREQDEGFDLPQDASSALESLTDADLQTLLQNFEDLSQEEQQHLHTYMKKLEASDPARVEKLRKYIDRSDLKEKMEKHAPVERIDTKNDLKSKTRTKRKSDPYKDMFYDDTKSGNGNSAAIVDSDDDDYSYDDLCKAASKNIKEQQRELESKQRSPEVLSDSDSVNRHDQFILGGERGSHYDDLSNASRASGENSNPRAALNDCESIIANLMGSLQKNVQNRNLSDRNQMDATNNDAQMQRHQIQSNVPFYLQQQTQSSYTMSNAKTSNQMYANDFNLNGPNGHFSSSNQYSNAFGNQNQNQNYGNAQKRVNIISNIPLNIPAFAQQQHNQQQQQQQQPQALTNQQAALLAQFSQQQNRRQPW